jgi:membrane-anchored mycosin MYCP
LAGLGDDLIAVRRVGAAVACGALLAIVVSTAPAAAAPDQWYLDKVGVPAAHSVARGDGVRIGMFTDAAAVGNDKLTDAPDMLGQFLPGATFADRKLTDEPPERDADDVFIASEPLMVSRGASGLIGVAPGAKIIPIAGDTFGGDQIRWMVDRGAKVINYYRSTSTVNPDVRDAEAAALRYALSKDVVVVVDAVSTAGGPDVPGLIVVGATDRDDRRVADGRGQDRSGQRTPALVAPHGQRQQLAPEDVGKGYWDVNLFFPEESAAAIVAGVAALVRSKYPDLNAASVVNRMLRTARDLGPSGRDAEYGYGLVDVAAALNADIAPVAANPLGEPAPDDEQDWLAPVAVAAAIGLVVVGVAVVLLRRRRRRA